MGEIGNSLGAIFFFILILGIGVFLIWFFVFKVKHLRTPDVFCVDGGVKTGKSLVTVYLAVRQIRINRFKVFIANLFRRFFNLFRPKDKKKALREKPMLYSNMPLNRVQYNDLTLDIILREVSVPPLSVCLIDEATLLADSMSGAVSRNMSREDRERFDYVNEHLTLFLKLYGHYSKGGSCFYNSQQITDLHFAFKRCTSSYLFIAKNRKFPFFFLLDVRECVHSEDGDSVNTYTQDIDTDNKPLFIWKKYVKYYDRYYLSALTDKLPRKVNYNVPKYVYKKNLKAKYIATLGTYREISDFNKQITLAMEKEGSDYEKKCA